MNMSPNTHASTPAIGEKLRAARKQQKMSLRELSEKAYISASMLSQIETGKVYPSVRSMYSIAAALAVPVDYFFPEPASTAAGLPEEGSLVAGDLTASDLREARMNQTADISPVEFIPHTQFPAPIVHANQRTVIELRGGVNWARLTAQAEPGVEFLEIAYAAGAVSGENMSHHHGREFGIILEGELVVELAFESYVLGTGDSIIFNSSTPHRLVNRSDKPARAVWVVFSPVSTAPE